MDVLTDAKNLALNRNLLLNINLLYQEPLDNPRI